MVVRSARAAAATTTTTSMATTTKSTKRGGSTSTSTAPKQDPPAKKRTRRNDAAAELNDDDEDAANDGDDAILTELREAHETLSRWSQDDADRAELDRLTTRVASRAVLGSASRLVRAMGARCLVDVLFLHAPEAVSYTHLRAHET